MFLLSSVYYSEFHVSADDCVQCMKLQVMDWVRWEHKFIHTYVYVFTNPSSWEGCDTGSIFQGSLTCLNSEISFSKTGCLTKAKEPSLPYYLPLAGRRIIRFIPFPRVLVQCEMQSASSRIWTWCVCVCVCVNVKPEKRKNVTLWHDSS